MSLKIWLRKEDLLTCQPALRDAGVKKPSDLCELLEGDIQDLGLNANWKVSTRRRMIKSMNKLKSEQSKIEVRPSKSKSVSRSKRKSAAKKQGGHELLYGNFRKNDDDRRRRWKSMKSKSVKRTKSLRATDDNIMQLPEKEISKRVKASALLQNQYIRKPAYTKKTIRKDDCKTESNSEKKGIWRQSASAACSFNTPLPCAPRGLTVDSSSEEVVLCNIPERLPRLKSLKNCCDALKDQLLLCNLPQIPTPTQGEIEKQIRGLKYELDTKFIAALTQVRETNLDDMNALIKWIDKFKTMLHGRRAKLEGLFVKLMKEKPRKDDNVLRRMAEHRETLATHKSFAIEYQNAVDELETYNEKLAVIDHKTFAEMKVMKQPPKVLKNLLTGVCMVFGMSKPSWREATSFICRRDMRHKLLNFDPKVLDPKARHKATKFILENMDSFNPVRVEGVNRKAVLLADWVEGLNRVFVVCMKLEKFPNGEKILRKIQKAHSELKRNKALIAKMEQERISWENVLDQLSWDIKLLQQCGNVQNKIKEHPQKVIEYLEERKLPQFDEITLPENFKIPFEEACMNIRSKFGKLTAAELKLIFSMIKKYFLIMVRLYKTYASLEGKKRLGLRGMSRTMWGVCCESMELGKLSEDEAQNFIYEIFSRSAMKTMISSKHSVEVAAFREKSLGRKVVEDAKNDRGLTGVWQLGKSTTQLWTIETKFGGGFTGFIGSERNATLQGKISGNNMLNFRIAWGKESIMGKLTAKCKAMLVDGATLHVRYAMSNKKKGYWILKKTRAKIRKQNKGTSALQYSSFVEAIIQMSIHIWNDLQPWKAIEALMERHIIPKAFANWDVVPETNDTVQRYFNRKEVKSILLAIFKKYSVGRNRRGMLLYPKWEKFVRKINVSAHGILQKASLRTIQFSFFASKVMFPEMGGWNELKYNEFICAVARLAFLMVAVQGFTEQKPKLSLQCQTMISWLKRGQW